MNAMEEFLTVAILAVAGGTGVFEAHQNFKLREENQLLLQQQASLVEQIDQLRHEHEEATNKLALLAYEVRGKSTLLPEDEQLRELQRLRGAVELARRRLDEANKQATNEQARHQASEQLVALDEGTKLIEKITVRHAMGLLAEQNLGTNATPSLDDLATALKVPETVAQANPFDGLRDDKMQQYWPYFRFKAECEAALKAVGN
jgi:hypothetical protein